ncbi:MAG: hypothetical protein K8J31_27620 [Anaerolineae bacterium]|nr:hypothetical protein [Anaerolineae bacterium]
MILSADLLWRINNEYQKRLKQTQTYLGLLEQLTLVQGGDGSTLAALRMALEQIEVLYQEHREWRYRYYYESADTHRMVQSHGAVQEALAHFSRMRSRHEYQLARLQSTLLHIPRPDPLLTRVPIGDLWVMSEFAITDLSRFDDYMRSLTVSSH